MRSPRFPCLPVVAALVAFLSAAAADSDDHARWEALRAELARHDELYFRHATAEITDAEYDNLQRELHALEQAHPEWVVVEETVADDRTGRRPVRRHELPMLSLEKCYTAEEWRRGHADWVRRLGRDDFALVIEPKYDGVAVSLLYERGRLARALTRGNGREGEDVTAAVRRLLALPAELRPTRSDGGPNPIPDRVELRAEIYVDLAEYRRINAAREAAGEEPFTHPRNLAAGTLLAESADAEVRQLSVTIHGWGAWEGTPAPGTQSAFHSQVADWGLPAVAVFQTAHSPVETWAAVEWFERRRKSLPFPIDGAVVKVDDVALRGPLGESGRAPHWALACKFAPARASTRVRDITLQVGRSGALTPVAELDPVMVGGALVSRVTLHNRAEIARRDVRPGDWVEIERAGDVIPALVRVDRSRRPSSSRPFIFPAECPACAGPLAAAAGDAVIRCDNPACPAQRQRRLEHFASAAAMKLEGFGPATIARLVADGCLRTPADFYALDRATLRRVPGLGEATVNRLLAAVARSRQRELSRVIYGLGLREVGPAGARELARQAGSLRGLESLAEPARAAALDPRLRSAVARYLSQESNREVLRRLVAAGVGEGEVVGGNAAPGREPVLTGGWRGPGERDGS